MLGNRRNNILGNYINKEAYLLNMELRKLDSNTWELPQQEGMRVPGIIYASEKLIENIKKDMTLKQVANVACLKGIQRASYAMPDAHQGYGFPIGGVAAFDPEEGIISPGGVGYDINCSVRMLRTELTEKDVMNKKRDVLDLLFEKVPSGVGRAGQLRLDRDTIAQVIEKGAGWAIGNGYGKKEDAVRTEENGCMAEADFSCISQKAISRGLPQLGTLGAGNHFLEVQKVDQIFDEKVARRFGITAKGQVTVMIHCGSRGLGHQVASDYIRQMEDKYGFKGLPDRELINAPLQSELGQRYFKAMSGAANFAFANKQMITHWVRQSFERIFGSSEGMELVYDICHNIAKMERHEMDGSRKMLCVHRKGATRSFGPGREEIPEVYRDIGQPIILPGSMGTASYLLAGTSQAEKLSFGSTAHGAGRVMSRQEAIRSFRGEAIKSELASRGIEIKGASWRGIAEETYQAYKDIDEVVRVSNDAGIGRLVCRVVPLAVMKG